MLFKGEDKGAKKCVNCTLLRDEYECFFPVTRNIADLCCPWAFRCLSSVEQVFQVPRRSPRGNAQHYKLQQGTSGEGECVEEAASRDGDRGPDAGEPVSWQGFASGLSFSVPSTLKMKSGQCMYCRALWVG